jgi:hypothetical protein
MKSQWRAIVVVTIAGLLSVIPTRHRMPHAGLLGDRPMTGRGAGRRSIHCVGTVGLFVLPYASSAAACIPGTEAIKLTVLLKPGAQSA